MTMSDPRIEALVRELHDANCHIRDLRTAIDRAVRAGIRLAAEVVNDLKNPYQPNDWGDVDCAAARQDGQNDGWFDGQYDALEAIRALTEDNK
jgi:hypothetical protein